MTPSDADKPVVVLIGNYPLDRQESMLRFRDLVQANLEADGITVVPMAPQGRLGSLVSRGPLAKWLRYIDKYILFRASSPGSGGVSPDEKSSSTFAIIPTRYMRVRPGNGFRSS